MEAKKPTPELDTLRGRLREARQARGWSMADLAERSGVDGSTVARIETGVFQPKVETITLLARSLGVTVDDLLGLKRKRGITAPLPTFTPYLRKKYQELPAEAVDDLERHFQLLAEKHGVKGYGPQPGEDEFDDFN